MGRIREGSHWLRKMALRIRTHGIACHSDEAGIRRGDAVLVHSGITGFEGFDGTVPNIVTVFEDAVGLGRHLDDANPVDVG